MIFWLLGGKEKKKGEGNGKDLLELTEALSLFQCE